MTTNVFEPIHVRLLGPPCAFAGDRELDLGPPRQRALFAVLALRPDTPVGRDELVDAVWGENIPGNPVGGVHTYVAGLRRVLEPGRGRRATGTLLVSQGTGYRLRIPPERVDAVEFERLLGLARRQRAAGDPAAAERSFDAALGLFEGTALGGVPGPFAESSRARLAEQRLGAVEDRIDAVLEQGRHGEVGAVLRALTEQHPLRERLWGQLMLALYRSGRQADALAAYGRARRHTREDLGLDPGPILRDLRQRIITADPALTAAAGTAHARPTPSAPGANGRHPVRCDLPRDVGDFTGRGAEIRMLLADIGRRPAAAGPAGPTVWAIDGMAGVGKTTLAVHAAHRLAARYPDAQLYLDLHAHTPDHQPLTADGALDKLLRAAGPAGAHGPAIPADPDERAALWRSVLAGRRMLLVLDNAADTAQIRPLLPGAADTLVLVTSRRRLTGLEAAEFLTLRVLGPREGTDLFARVAGRDRAAQQPQAVARAVDLCGHLPLAIRIAAARLRHHSTWNVGHLLGLLEAEDQRLDELRGEDRGVTAAFSLSYRALDADQRRLLRLLGVLPGPDFDTHTVAALCGVRLARARELVEALVDTNLVEESAAGSYLMHDLLRLFALAVCRAEEPGPAQRAALARVVAYYQHLTNLAEDKIRPGRLDRGPDAAPEIVLPAFADREAALSRLDCERANLVGIVAAAAGAGMHEPAWRIARHLWGFYETRRLWSDWIATHESALPSARLCGDRLAEARLLVGLGVCYHDLRRYDQAISRYLSALTLMREIGFTGGEAGVLNNLGNSYHAVGQLDEAIECQEQSLALCRSTGNRFAEGVALANLGERLRQAGSLAQSAERQRQAIAIFRELGDRRLEGNALENLARTLQAAGDTASAIAHCHEALQARRESGDRYGEAVTLDNLGEALRSLGRLEEADRCWRQALAVFESLGAPEAAEMRARLVPPGAPRAAAPSQAPDTR
jgi:DNA-binding SARP family transcriptional activator/tetratricopeptide (TPR) repeat protein